MSAGTKIFLAVVVLFVGGLVVYYGVLSPAPEATIQKDADNADGAASNTTGDAEVWRNQLPGDPAPAGTDETSRHRETHLPEHSAVRQPETMQSNLARPDDRGPRHRTPAANAGSGLPISDGGKELPGESSSMGPPMPSEPNASSAAQRETAGTPPLTRTATMTSDAQDNAAEPEPERRIAYYLYTVRSGDTLAWIAEDWFGETGKWDLIAAMNPGLDPNRLRVGQTIKLPPRDATRASTRTVARNGDGTYIVKSGDTLSVIAHKVYGRSTLWEAIYDANRQTIGSDPHALKVGMKLAIPKR